MRAILKGALYCLRAGMRWVLLNLLFRLSTRWRVDGMEIIDASGEDGEIRDKLQAALALIAEVNPILYERIKRDLERIVLVRRGGPEYASEVHACLLPSGYVRDGTAHAVATTVVHEATHARLWNAGIRYGPDLRARVEIACIKQQIAFASLLGDAHILAHLHRRLEAPIENPL